MHSRLSTASKSSTYVLLFSCIILITGLMAIDFISPSLPYIQQDFHVSQTVMKNTVLLYMLMLGVGQLFYGYVCDRYGRRPVILVAFVISFLGIGMSAIANNITLFYIARAITALGSAGCPVIARTMITDVSKSPTELKKAFSIYALSSQLSPGIAPLIGGFLQTYTTWRLSLVTLMIINIVVLKQPKHPCLIKNSKTPPDVFNFYRSALRAPLISQTFCKRLGPFCIHQCTRMPLFTG